MSLISEWFLSLHGWSVLIYFDVFISYFDRFIMIQLVYWKIWKARFKFETVVIIAKAHISQRKIVQYISQLA